MTIDNLLPESWSDDDVAALDAWRQGHLVRCELGVWLAVAGRVDPVTGYEVVSDTDGLDAVKADIGDTGYAAVVSQTCDIAAAGPGERHPFVQVCPVRDVGTAFNPEKVAVIRAGEKVEYVYLTKPPEPGKDWAVDLRMSVPLSKGVLIASEPIDAFEREADEIALAARVAAKFERPALHDYLSQDLIQGLNKCISNARKKGQDWCEDVEQVRLEITGPRLAPDRVRLIVVTDVEFNGLFTSKRSALREHWQSHKKRLKAAGIEQEPIAFRNVEKLLAKNYRNSIPLNLPSLGRGRFD